MMVKIFFFIVAKLIFLQSIFAISADFELILLPNIKMESSQIEVRENLILISSRDNDTNFVYMSTNEGLDWVTILKEIKPAYYPIAPFIINLHIFDKNTFFLSYDEGRIKFTSNTGLNWVELKPDSNKDIVYAYSMFSYLGNMYLINHYFSKLISNGNFMNWSTLDSPYEFIKEPYLIADMQFLNDGNLKLSVYDTIVNNWQYFNVDLNLGNKYQFILKEDMHRFYFLNKDTGWCFFKPPHSLIKQYPDNWNSQIIYKTTDAGLSWVKQLDTTIQRVALQGINFISDEVGFAYGAGDVILFTEDGGNNWEYITEKISNKFIGYISSFKMVNSDVALFNATEKLYILKRKTTSISENNIEKLVIYPNPATDYITIIISDLNRRVNPTDEGDVVVEIYDVMGIEVMSDVGHLNRIDVSNLAPGVYFLKIVGSNGVGSIVQKFVKY